MQDSQKDWSGASQVVPRKDSLPTAVGITFVPHVFLSSVEMATQMALLFVLILRAWRARELFRPVGVSLFQLRIRLGHEVTYFTLLKSWVLSDLVPWMLRVWVTGLHVAGQIFGHFSHVTTLTAHEAATNVYKAFPSVIPVKIEDAFSCLPVFLLGLAERGDLA